MPVVEHVGQGPFTEQKQILFRQLCTYIMKIAKSTAIKSQPWAYQTLQYIDATAGHGREDSYGKGSATIFIDVARELDLDYSATFIEENPDVFTGLINNIPTDVRHNLHQGSYQNALPRLSIPAKAFGLLYVDPNGVNEKSLDTMILREFCKKNPYIDILLRLSANNLKRGPHSKRRICDVVEGIGKTNWSMTEPAASDKDEWIFLLGTNSSSPLGVYKKVGLHPIEDTQVQQALCACTFTRHEQLLLNFVDTPYTMVTTKPLHTNSQSLLQKLLETRKRLVAVTNQI